LDALTQHSNGLVDVNAAIVALSGKVAALTPATTATTGTTASGGSTTVVESGVSSFNAETGAVVYFPSLGIVNNQTGAAAYVTQTQDNGALIVLSNAGAIAVSLNFTVTAPWFTTIANQGSGTATLTPTQGTINGAGTFSIAGGTFAGIYFDGANWWAFEPPSGGGVTAVTGTAPIVSSGGTTPAISINPATSSTFGSVKPDNTTITVAAGVISAVGGGGGGVTQIIAGTNITISPSGGTGAVTVSASGGGASVITHTYTFAAGTLGPGAESTIVLASTTLPGLTSTTPITLNFVLSSDGNTPFYIATNVTFNPDTSGVTIQVFNTSSSLTWTYTGVQILVSAIL
jgi:hypothetical protein